MATALLLQILLTRYSVARALGSLSQPTHAPLCPWAALQVPILAFQRAAASYGRSHGTPDS